MCLLAQMIYLKIPFRQNFKGKSILYSSREMIQKEHVLIQWIENAASRLNTTAQRSIHSCSFEKIDLSDWCYHKHFKDNKVDIDLYGYYTLGAIDSRFFNWLLTNLQTDSAILVPISALNIVEIFTLPFNWQVWVLLALILATVEGFHLTLPKIFRNEPVLTAVCGYEKYDLHKSNHWEKIILFSLIVFIFFITQAYEIKLLSMMISRPATSKIETLEDLLRSSVKIKVDFLQYPTIENNPLLENMLINGSESIFELNMVDATIMSRDWAKIILPMYYDPVQRLHRYTVIAQSLGVYPVMFMLRKRCPLNDVLGQTLAGFVENGIHDYLSNLEKTFVVENIALVGKFPDARISLNFSDLAPAWLAWLFGFSVSTLGFVFEVIFYRLIHCCSGMKLKVLIERNVNFVESKISNFY